MLTALALAFALFGSHKTIVHKTLPVAGWRLTVRKDEFTGGVTCKAARRDVALQNGMLVFALGSAVDSSDADYRIDLGAAHSVHEVALRDRVLGAPITLEPINNPSRGLVVLPASDVAGASVVWIRASSHSAPLRFTVQGLQSVMDQEKLAGCA